MLNLIAAVIEAKGQYSSTARISTKEEVGEARGGRKRKDGVKGFMKFNGGEEGEGEGRRDIPQADHDYIYPSRSYRKRYE